MLPEIEGIKQSEKFKLYLLTDDNIWDVTKISENFQELEDIIKNLSQDDEHIQVIAKSKKLNLVLKDLENKDTEIISTMKEYKSSVDEYSKQLGIYVNRHSTANTKLEALL